MKEHGHIESAFARKLSAYVTLEAPDVDHLRRLQRNPRKFEPRTEIVHEAQVGARAFIVNDGWAMSYKLLSDGGRQVVDFQIPGDFLGLRSLLLRTSDHTVATITNLEAFEIDAAELRNVMEEVPRLGMAILWAMSRDEAMVVEHLVNVGRRPPLARTAHLFLEIRDRLSLVQPNGATEFECPLSQYVLADALGLSAIHLNRVLRQLRERGLMTLRRGLATIHDPAGLAALAGFESGYLDHGNV